MKKYTITYSNTIVIVYTKTVEVHGTSYHTTSVIIHTIS